MSNPHAVYPVNERDWNLLLTVLGDADTLKRAHKSARQIAEVGVIFPLDEFRELLEQHLGFKFSDPLTPKMIGQRAIGFFALECRRKMKVERS